MYQIKRLQGEDWETFLDSYGDAETALEHVLQQFDKLCYEYQRLVLEKTAAAEALATV